MLPCVTRWPLVIKQLLPVPSRPVPASLGHSRPITLCTPESPWIKGYRQPLGLTNHRPPATGNTSHKHAHTWICPLIYCRKHYTTGTSEKVLAITIFVLQQTMFYRSLIGVCHVWHHLAPSNYSQQITRCLQGGNSQTCFVG